ncbi:MAG: hypothetical protein JXQ85_13730 [Cognatishimia sp.]|uniref:TadE/TadG family type IV pilus assembly protein n=1 Tax=Cognatishimia sp. TaxID=2211648 RepID=UPI003B8B3B18
MTNILQFTKKRLKHFAQNLSGTVSVEAIIMLPILLWLVAAMAVFVDVFRTKSAMDKAAFTISDVLSRETNAITPEYLTNVRTLFEELAGLEDDSASVRVSLLEWGVADAATGVDTPDSEHTDGEHVIDGGDTPQGTATGSDINWALNIAWSEERGEAFLPMTSADLTDIDEFLPEFAKTDTLILVETYYNYQPLYDIGLMQAGFRSEVDEDTIVGYDEETGEPIYQRIAWDLDFGARDMMTFVFTRPRYASQLVFDPAG